MVSRWIALVVYILVGFSESAFVDTFPKCAIKDLECQKDLLQKIIVDNSESGVPEYEVPPFDPFKIKNVDISLLGLLTITVEDADSSGIKDCIINNFVPTIEKGFAEVDVTCDLTIKGKYKLSGTNPVADSLFGNKPIHGDGNGEMKFEKLHLGLKFFFDLVKKDDEIYFSFKYNQTEYVYDLQNFHATFDNVFLGEEDVSERFMAYLNENWKFVLNTFGKIVFEAALDLLHGILERLTGSIPTSKLISDDLTPYIKND